MGLCPGDPFHEHRRSKEGHPCVGDTSAHHSLVGSSVGDACSPAVAIAFPARAAVVSLADSDGGGRREGLEKRMAHSGGGGRRCLRARQRWTPLSRIPIGLRNRTLSDSRQTPTCALFVMKNLTLDDAMGFRPITNQVEPCGLGGVMEPHRLGPTKAYALFLPWTPSTFDVHTPSSGRFVTSHTGQDWQYLTVKSLAGAGDPDHFLG